MISQEFTLGLLIGPRHANFGYQSLLGHILHFLSTLGLPKCTVGTLGIVMAHLGLPNASWAHLGAFWAHLGAFWAHLG